MKWWWREYTNVRRKALRGRLLLSRDRNWKKSGYRMSCRVWKPSIHLSKSRTTSSLVQIPTACRTSKSAARAASWGWKRNMVRIRICPCSYWTDLKPICRRSRIWTWTAWLPLRYWRMRPLRLFMVRKRPMVLWSSRRWSRRRDGCAWVIKATSPWQRPTWRIITWWMPTKR